MHKKLIFILPAFSFLLFIIVMVMFFKKENKNIQNSNLTFKGVTCLGDSSIVNIDSYKESIVAYVNTSCGVCAEEIKDLIEIGDSTNIEVIILSTENYKDLRDNIHLKDQSKNLHILSITSSVAKKFNFNDYPYFLFYKNGILVKDHKGKINASVYIKNIFG
ncbi:MAG TPA: hypothetical protein VL443_14085 [Cyclobacteriaceae bacterium]|nr:hypothetical protein [Cyclobacteriaceae bacterium]